MQKMELLELLRDPDVSREIFEIFKRGGKPLPPEKPVEEKPTPPPVEQLSEHDRILALRQKFRQSMLESKSQPAPQIEPAQNPPPVTPPRRRIRKNIAQTPTIQAAPAAAPPKSSSLTDKLQFLREQAQKVKDEQALQEAELATRTPEEIATEKYSFVVERVCPICEMQTRIVHIKSRLIMEKQDLDLCTYYQDFNPYLYSVWACENCGFAAEDTRFRGHIPQRTREKIYAFLQTNNLVVPFMEERTVEDALSFYEIAILFSEIFDPSPGRQASLYQKMAWICRLEEPGTEREKNFLRKAVELYKVSLETERYPIGKISDDMAMYLTCAIYFMLGDYDNAVKQLSHIMNDQSLRTNAPKMFDKARDMWQEIKRIRKIDNSA